MFRHKGHYSQNRLEKVEQLSRTISTNLSNGNLQSLDLSEPGIIFADMQKAFLLYDIDYNDPIHEIVNVIPAHTTLQQLVLQPALIELSTLSCEIIETIRLSNYINLDKIFDLLKKKEIKIENFVYVPNTLKNVLGEVWFEQFEEHWIKKDSNKLHSSSFSTQYLQPTSIPTNNLLLDESLVQGALSEWSSILDVSAIPNIDEVTIISFDDDVELDPKSSDANESGMSFHPLQARLQNLSQKLSTSIVFNDSTISWVDVPEFQSNLDKSLIVTPRKECLQRKLDFSQQQILDTKYLVNSEDKEDLDTTIDDFSRYLQSNTNTSTIEDLKNKLAEHSNFLLKCVEQQTIDQDQFSKIQNSLLQLEDVIEKKIEEDPYQRLLELESGILLQAIKANVLLSELKNKKEQGEAINSKKYEDKSEIIMQDMENLLTFLAKLDQSDDIKNHEFKTEIEDLSAKTKQKAGVIVKVIDEILDCIIESKQNAASVDVSHEEDGQQESEANKENDKQEKGYHEELGEKKDLVAEVLETKEVVIEQPVVSSPIGKEEIVEEFDILYEKGRLPTSLSNYQPTYTTHAPYSKTFNETNLDPNNILAGFSIRDVNREDLKPIGLTKEEVQQLEGKEGLPITTDTGTTFRMRRDINNKTLQLSFTKDDMAKLNETDDEQCFRAMKDMLYMVMQIIVKKRTVVFFSNNKAVDAVGMWFALKLKEAGLNRLNVVFYTEPVPKGYVLTEEDVRKHGKRITSQNQILPNLKLDPKQQELVTRFIKNLPTQIINNPENKSTDFIGALQQLSFFRKVKKQLHDDEKPTLVHQAQVGLVQ